MRIGSQTTGDLRAIYMNKPRQTKAPIDAKERRRSPPAVCYPSGQLPPFDAPFYEGVRRGATKVDEIVIPPRDAKVFEVTEGDFFSITSIEGPQVGDLNLWNANNLSERFFSGKTRALHATHVSTGDKLWSSLPYLRPLATITHDTLDWYGWDQDGAGIHDVIGTRCDPYTNMLLNDTEYHYCCHSNLTRALATYKNMTLVDAETHIHDVLNVFMCTGFTREDHKYFMKASPVRPGDFIEFFAEIDLLAALSTCPGGDCSSGHSSDAAQCYPLKVEIYRPRKGALAELSPSEPNRYSRQHIAE